MTKNKKKIFQFGVGALLSVSLIFGVIIHEIVREGNQRKLFFPFLQERKAFELDNESCREFSANLDIKTQILLIY